MVAVRNRVTARGGTLLAVGCFKRGLNEATTRLTCSDIPVNSWAKFVPEVEASRPSHCPACGQAAHKANGRLRLHGHGMRSRGIWGPRTATGEPELWEIQVRRYLCVDCRACPTVLPAGLQRAYRYSLGAIAMALALWALGRQPAAEVRRLVSPQRQLGDSEPSRWRSLRRWTRAAHRLFNLAARPAGATTRELAERIAQLVLARAPTEVAELERAFVGAQVR